MEFNDPRINVFARHTISSVEAGSPEYVGVPNGLNDVNALTYNGGARNVFRVGALYYEGALTPPGLQVVKVYIRSYPDLQFILAEAVLEEYIPGGSAAAREDTEAGESDRAGLNSSHYVATHMQS